MKILFVLGDFFYPPMDGIQVNMVNLLRYLSSEGNDCDVLGMYRSNSKLQVDELMMQSNRIKIAGLYKNSNSYARRMALGFITDKLQAFGKLKIGRDQFAERLQIKMRAGSYDVIHIEGIVMAPYIKLAKGHPIVFSCLDANSLRQGRLFLVADNYREKAYRWMARKFSISLEKTILQQVEKVHVVSDADCEYLRNSVPGIDIECIPISIPAEITGNSVVKPQNSRKRTLLFTGDLRLAYINRGLLWFLREVYPNIVKRFPDVALTVLGRKSPGRELTNVLGYTKGVKILSWVDDYYKELSQAEIVVVPDPAGTGLKNRVIQAMALGKPVVGTRWALEGLQIKDGVQAYKRDTKKGFFEAVATLLEERQTYESMSREARSYVLKRHTVETIGRQWLKLYEGAIAKKTFQKNKTTHLKVSV